MKDRVQTNYLYKSLRYRIAVGYSEMRFMCLAVPAKVIEKSPDGKTAKVDFGDSITREVDVSLVEADIGDYVLVHAGFAIEVLNPKEAAETLKAWEELLKAAI